MGGSARTWDGILSANILANSELELNLVMTKHESPDVRIGYAIEIDRPVSVDDNPQQLPNRFNLAQNFPNPFNPETTISYQLAERSQVTIAIFNTLGQKIRTLVDNIEPPGRHQITWDGKNAVGVLAPSGIYFYRIQTDGFTQTRQMLLLK